MVFRLRSPKQIGNGVPIFGVPIHMTKLESLQALADVLASAAAQVYTHASGCVKGLRQTLKLLR